MFFSFNQLAKITKAFLAISLVFVLPQLAISKDKAEETAKKQNAETISKTPAGGKSDNGSVPPATEEGEVEHENEFIPSGESADFEDIELED